MAIDPKIDPEEDKIKEFLNRAEVKTMRKDLQKLRESIALKEREKIVKIKTPEEEKAERERLEKIKQEDLEKQNLEKQRQESSEAIQKKVGEEIKTMSQIKEFAQENEKQQIFYLESEKIDLQKKLQILQKDKESPLLLRKNRLLLERNDVEDRLGIISEEEKKIESEEDFVGEAEKTANVPKDKQSLEKKRWDLEKKREELERKRWLVEQESEKIETQTKEVDAEYQNIQNEEKTLKDRITAIGDSLRSTYLGITSREEERIKLEKEGRTAEALKRAEVESERKEEIRRQEWKIKEKPFLREIPDEEKKEQLVKKIEETSIKEGDERKKFLEDVEEWAKEEEKHE